MKINCKTILATAALATLSGCASSVPTTYQQVPLSNTYSRIGQDTLAEFCSNAGQISRTIMRARFGSDRAPKSQVLNAMNAEGGNQIWAHEIATAAYRLPTSQIGPFALAEQIEGMCLEIDEPSVIVSQNHIDSMPSAEKIVIRQREDYAASNKSPLEQAEEVGGDINGPCGRIEIRDAYSPSGNVKVYDIPSIGCVAEESGEIQGVPYSVNLTSGAGRFYNEPAPHGVGEDIHWVVNCSTDSITDARSCTIRRDGFFLYWQNGYSIMTTGEAYPGSNMSFRVDDNPAFSAPENTGLTGSAANRLVQQMQVGRTLITRHLDWPYNTRVDKTIPVHGFFEALTYMRSVR
ncbi:hypothetical protein ACT3TC_13260 [Halomonas sp. AOP27-A1-41]|uniref:hypothetical protein n=1 Tax=Halomonas sp. AOP27-A1-41 TaxID=3457707 RepID=UPI00403342F3